MAKKKLTTAENKERERHETKRRRRTAILVVLAIFTTTCAIVLATRVIPHEVDLAASRREVAAFSETPAMVWSSLSLHNEKMRGINPDYVGFMSIEGTSIHYPVVRGSDNVKYLNTSFEGAENQFGALFMDYRCVGVNLPHIIVYGHRIIDVRGNGHFFGGLNEFLDEQYRAERSVITFIENDHASEFEIFSVRVTDINDPAYDLDFSAPDSFEAFLERNGAPPDAAQILTLSTCDGSGEDDGRTIVQAVRKRIFPVDENQQ